MSISTVEEGRVWCALQPLNRLEAPIHPKVGRDTDAPGLLSPRIFACGKSPDTPLQYLSSINHFVSFLRLGAARRLETPKLCA